MDRLCQCARKANAYVVMGINEKVPETLGTLYNTNVLIDRKGKILGAHRNWFPLSSKNSPGEGETVHLEGLRYGYR